MRRVLLYMLVVLVGTAAALLLGAGMAVSMLGQGLMPTLAEPADVEMVEQPWGDAQADRRPGAGLQRPDPGPWSGPGASGRPVPGPDSQSREVPPGLEQIRDLRRRVHEAAEIGRRARAGDQTAATEVARRVADEADPRVREALATGESPDLGRFRWAPPVLPAPATAAEPGEVKAWWLTPDNHDGTYESTVTIAANGRAMVDTVFEPTEGGRWHVRYPAWAFRDAQGRLILDARGQDVECLEKPPHGWWSPDSMVIGKDGLIDMIDDKHDPGVGTSGADGPG